MKLLETKPPSSLHPIHQTQGLKSLITVITLLLTPRVRLALQPQSGQRWQHVQMHTQCIRIWLTFGADALVLHVQHSLTGAAFMDRFIDRTLQDAFWLQFAFKIGLHWKQPFVLVLIDFMLIFAFFHPSYII